MIEDEKTSTDRIARIGLAFTLAGGIIGIGVFLIVRFALGLSDWISIPAGWAVGLGVGVGLSRYRITRKMVLNVVGFLSEIRYLR